MTPYVLLVATFVNSGIGVNFQEFHDRASCEAAGVALREMATQMRHVSYAPQIRCVPRGQPQMARN